MNSKVLKLAAGGVFFLLVIIWFVHFLNRFHYLPGPDAYYYALQAQSLLDSGHLKVADGGIINYLLAAFCRIGMPAATAFNFVLAVIFGIYNLGILLLLLRIKQETWPVGLTLWTISNSVIAFHVIEFPELSLGLALIPSWFWLLASNFKRRALWLLILLAGSAFVHTAVAILALLFAATTLISQKIIPPLQRKRPLLIALLSTIAGCVVLIIVFAVKAKSFALRLASLRPGPAGLFGLVAADVPDDLKFTLLFFWLLLLVLFFVVLSGHAGRWKYLSVAVLALPMWPSHDSGLLGLGGRLAVLFVFLALPLTILVYDEISDRLKLAMGLQSSRAGLTLALAAIAALAFLPARLNSYDGLLMSDDYAAYEKIVTALQKADIPMLIAHRGLDFFYSYRLRRDAFHFDPEPEWKRDEIWRVAMRISPEEAAYYSPPSCIWGETGKTIPGTDYLLIREGCWEQLRASIRQSENPDLYIEVWDDMENPSQRRPAFLRARHGN